ncbi:MAG TPA: SAM hydroxide adenosyltransferase [Armatimonadota bacterium]|jgi:pimeloyl-ACP methyl ester carboxylesterase
MRGSITILALFLASFALAQGVDKRIKVEEGALGPSKIVIAVAKKWNKRVLILAHGLRSESEPLSANFNYADGCYRQLLKEGWMVAATSYRRNGYLHDEAIEDIDQLRQHILDTYGTPKRIYIQGASMGGAIVAKIAEIRKDQYDGVLAIGAALGVGSIKYSFAPQMPLLFVSNQSELGDPKLYLERAANPLVKPVRWLVKRDGHCNLNDAEILTSLRALFAYRETGKIEADRDVTVVLTPASTARFSDGGAVAAVTHAPFNIETAFVAADLEKLGIARGNTFSVSFNDKTVKVFLGASYFDVPRGEWVAFITADGYLRVARNFDNAAAVLGCKEKDEIIVRAIPRDNAK